MMTLQWEEYPLSHSAYLTLPIARLEITPKKEWNPDKSWNAPNQIIVGYHLEIVDGDEGHTFALKDVPVAAMDELKKQALDFLREKIQETLEIINNG